MASRTCEDCQKWWYDDAWDAEAKRFRFSSKIVSKGPVQFERLIDPKTKQRTPPPCQHCPKKSPALAHTVELSAKNHATYECYLNGRATEGRYYTKAMMADEVFVRNMKIIDRFVRVHEQIAIAAHRS